MPDGPPVDAAGRVHGGKDAALDLRLTRRPDGAVVFELRRANGTSTWQKRFGPSAEFFVMHDLTHFAVETVLGVTHGFYGMVAQGWDFTDFGTPWPRGPLPAETLRAEVIVGCFDTQRAAGVPLTAEQCNGAAAAYFSSAGRESPVPVNDAQLDAIRTLLSDLMRRWHALPARDTLHLTYGLDTSRGDHPA